MRSSILCLVLSVASCGSHTEGQLVPKTVTDNPNLPRFTLSDGRVLHVRELGDAASRTVFVLHGGPGGDSRSYLHFEEELPELHVVLWDQRGSGLSERVPESELTGLRFCADLAELGEAFSPEEPFALIGHSWGGALATYCTREYPERVSHLVLVEPGALNPRAARTGNTSAVDFTGAKFQGYLQATDAFEPLSFAEADYFYVLALAGFKDEDTRLLGYDFWRLGYHANLAINRWQGNFDRSYSFDATRDVGAYSGATLFITGTDAGRLGNAFQLEHHVPHFPGAQVLHLPDVEHSDLLEDERALAAVRELLR